MSKQSKTTDLSKAILVTKEKADIIREPIQRALEALAGVGIENFALGLEYIVAAHLGHASSNEYDDKNHKTKDKTQSRPDAYTSTGKSVEYKGTKHCKALTKTYKSGKKHILTKAASKLANEKTLDFFANFNSANNEDKILDYLDWEIISYIHDKGKILAIAKLPSENVVEQLLDILVEKQQKRKNGQRVHDNFNSAKCEVHVQDLIYRNF